MNAWLTDHMALVICLSPFVYLTAELVLAVAFGRACRLRDDRGAAAVHPVWVAVLGVMLVGAGCVVVAGVLA